MKADRYKLVDSIFQAALDCAPDERAAFLDEACATDPSLRGEVEALIESHESAGSFIESPVYERAAELIAGSEASSIRGKRIGHYNVISLLGSGGMGEVFLAEDSRLGRKVALKLLPDHFTKDQDRLRRFRREARAASALNHPNIITIFEIGEAEAIHYIATEFIQGETLRQRISRARINVGEALSIAIQVSSALHTAHEAGIVHRDIKPENIMLRPDGYVKVLDFGLAKLSESVGMDTKALTRMTNITDVGSVMGTASYMSPEQARGLPVDGRSDTWSLGVVLYEITTGQRPFTGETPSDVIASILITEALPISHNLPEVPAELDRITAKALAKDRQERYQTVNEMTDDLKRLQRQLEIGTEHERAHSDAADKAKAALQETGAQLNSIAVLPFMTLGMEAGDEYLGLGLADALITQLGNARQIIVRPTSAVRRYTDAHRDSIAIGRDLRVSAVLEGSIQRTSERIRVTVQLVSVHDEVPLWAERFNARFTDILEVQDAIAEQVANALTLKLNSDEHKRLTKRYTENIEAYQAYLKGRVHWNKFTIDAVYKSIEFYNQAIAIDPTYALAYAGLADSYGLLAHGWLPPKEAYPKAKWAAEKALELDDMLAESHAAMAMINIFYDWDWAAAEREGKRALALNPNSPSANVATSAYLKTVGRYTEQLAMIRRAQELDPLSPLINTEIAEALYFAGRYDEALEQGRKTLEIDPYFVLAYHILGRSFQQKGMYAEAAELYQRAITQFGREPLLLGGLGHVFAAAGNRDEAQKLLGELSEMSSYRHVPSYDIALVYAGLGEMDQAFAWLEKAYEEQYFLLIWIKGEPRFASLRRDARFTDLLKRIGLAS